MAKIDDEHGNTQTVTFNDFKGGINTTSPPELIENNEMARAINVEIDSASGSLKTVAGTDDVYVKTQPSGVSFNYLLHDRIGNYMLVTDTARKAYAASMSDLTAFTEVGTLDGTGSVEYVAWEDGIIITSGGKLQYFHDGELETISNSFEDNASYWNKATVTTWQINHAYKLNDVVSYKGEKYICTADHTSSTGETTTYQERNLTYDSQYWEYAKTPSWNYSRSYSAYDYIQQSGKVYYCTKSHISTDYIHDRASTIEDDSAHWVYVGNKSHYVDVWDEVSGTTHGWITVKAPAWENGKSYRAASYSHDYWFDGPNSGDWVCFNDKIYMCVDDHTSSPSNIRTFGSFADDQAYWHEVEVAEWQNSKLYPVGAMVRHKNTLYLCKQQHTSCASASAITLVGLAETDTANWKLVDGKAWSYSTTYYPSDQVYVGSDIYVCNAFHTSCGEAPTSCHAPFVKDGRIYIAIGDELHCSGVGDERNWTVNSNDASASQWVQIGYKDGGRIVGIGSLASDIVIFKDNDRAYHLAGQYPNWALNEIGRQIDCKGFNSCVSLADQVLALGKTSLQTIRVTDQYGDMRCANVSPKVQKDIAAMGNIRLRYISGSNQVWMINGTKRFMFLDINNGGFYQREYHADIYDAVEAKDNVYVLKANKLCRLNSRHMNDEGMFLRWRLQGKTLTTVNQFLVKRSWVDTTPYFDTYTEALFLVDKVNLLAAVPTYAQGIWHDYTHIFRSNRWLRNPKSSPVFINSEDVYSNPDFIYNNDTQLKAISLYRSYIRQISRGQSIKLQGHGSGGPFLINGISYIVAEV